MMSLPSYAGSMITLPPLAVIPIASPLLVTALALISSTSSP